MTIVGGAAAADGAMVCPPFVRSVFIVASASNGAARFRRLIGKRRLDRRERIGKLARGGEALVAVAVERAREHCLQRRIAGDAIEIGRVRSTRRASDE